MSLLFDTLDGFNALKDTLKDTWNKEYSMQVVFEIGNISKYNFVRGNTYLVPDAYIHTIEGLPQHLDKERAIMSSYGVLKGTGYALRYVAGFYDKDDEERSFLIGCFINQSDQTQVWASGFAKKNKLKLGIKVGKLAKGDMGEFIGTAPGDDTWPKWGEVIPNWQVIDGGHKTATTGDWKSFAGKDIRIHFGMNSSIDDDGIQRYLVRAFVSDSDFKKSLPGESTPI